MLIYKREDNEIQIDFQKGCVVSLKHGTRELLCEQKVPLFKICLMADGGERTVLDTFDAKKAVDSDNGCIYSGFFEEILVEVTVDKGEEYFACWNISVKNDTDKLIEWVEFMDLPIGVKLEKNGGDGSILYPYMEGCIVDDIKLVERHFGEPSYPLSGSESMFPNIVFSQFLAYMFGESGLYIGAHDTERGVKWLAFVEENGGITTKIRSFPGLDFGEDYNPDYPLVWDFFEGSWHDGAEIYRKWFYNNKPHNLTPLCEPELPAWYKNMPLTVIYPIRGETDTDDMKPNSLYPYKNALPVLREIEEKTGAQVMALLMHWEGTAPWAPPYVWPPYGGEDEFNEFADALHAENKLLGVYCSGIGWTSQSRVLPEYNMDEVFEKNGYKDAMCIAPDGSLPYSRICTAQRSGYDLCPVSDTANKIMDDAYTELLKSKADYIQILDQNNGGNSYFCYSKEHGHPPAPGTWQIEAMNKLIDKWRSMGKDKLLGCEAAAAEPFTGGLRFSDDRFEIALSFGKAIPLYAYMFHEFLHNFMGNQCGTRLVGDSLSYRIAHAFTAGDCLSVTLTHDKKISRFWGVTGEDNCEDKDKILTLIGNLTKFRNETLPEWFYDAKMIKPLEFTCDSIEYYVRDYSVKGEHWFTADNVLSTAWESKNGDKIQIFVNHTTDKQNVKLADGRCFEILAQDAVVVKF